MNHARSLRTGIVTLACLCITAIRPNATDAADRPDPPAQSEPAVAATEESPDVRSLAAVLRPEMCRHYVEAFNRGDRETVVNHIPNAKAWDWLARNVPLFECPDQDLEEIYYFRWWTYRKHIKQTPDGFIITEFLPPVPWAGKHNSINCPAGHHFYEGRWLHDPRYLDDYAKLWDPQAEFYMVRPRGQSTLANVRELHGYTPWYFNLPDAEQSVAWRQLMDPLGFYAPFGPTTAEQGHPGFAVNYHGHGCQWNGPSWPLATSVTLTALANLLNNYSQDVITRADYWKTFQCYLRSRRFRQLPPLAIDLPDPSSAPGGSENRGEEAQLARIESRQPWIDENLNPFTGDWIARTLLKQRQQQPDERGKDYSHSTFCDLVITGVAGLRPRGDDRIELNPLLPEGTWDWFCLDRVRMKTKTTPDSSPGMSL